MNRFSITSKGIGDALQRSASALSASGNTLDESIGLITAANEVVQDPTSVGTALKTLSLRLRGAKTELEEAGLEAEGMATTTATLQKKLLGLTGGKVDIMLDPDTFKSSTQILREMAGAWEDMTDIQRSAALELMGGKRQANILSSIIQNFDTVESVIETSANSSNSALAENARWMDSIEGKSKQFTNAVSAMWNDAIGRDVIKTFVDIGTVLIKLADGVDIFGHKIGSLWTTVALVSTLLIKTFTKRTWGEFFLDIGTSIHSVNTKLEGFAARFGLVNAATQSAGAASKGLTVGLLQEKLAMAGVSEESQRALLAKMGLATVNRNTLVTSKQLTGSILREAVANKTLTMSQAASLMQKSGMITASKGLNVAIASNIMQLAGLDRTQRLSMISSLGLTMNTKNLTKEEIKAAVAKLALKDATKAQQLENLLLLASQGKLIASFKLLGMQINEFISKNALLITIAAAAAAIYGVTKAFDASITTLKESEESLTDLNSTLESTQSKLNDLESQLSDTKSRMEELNSLESLSFVEQEELDKLRSQTQELERQIALTKQIKAGQQKAVNNQAVETAEQYSDANFKSGKGKEDYKQTGATIGAVAGGIIGSILAVALAPVTGGLSILVGAAGATIGATGFGIGGSIVGGAYADTQNQVGEAMDDMLAQRKKLEEDYNKAKEAYAKNPEKKSIAEDYEEAEKALSDYDSMMSEHISKLDSYYSQIDLSVYDSIVDAEKIKQIRQEMNDFYDTQDKWLIQSGSKDAKSNAIARIFGENASQKLKDVKEKFEEAAEAGKEITVEDAFGNNSQADLDAFIKRINKLGLYTADVESYFKDLAKAEEGAAGVDFDGVVKSVNNISNALTKVTGALDEVNEYGFVTFNTLSELQELFKDMNLGDAWDNYFNTMASGVATSKEMIAVTEELANAVIKHYLSDGVISAEERQAYIVQLRHLGVENAEDLMDTVIRENAVEEMKRAADYDMEKVKEGYEKDKDKTNKWRSWDEMDDDARRDYAEWRGYDRAISAEEAQQIAEQYGIEIDNVDALIAKINELTAAREAERVAKLNADQYGEWKAKYDAEKKIIDDIKDDIKQFNEDDWHSIMSYDTEAGTSELKYYNAKTEQVVTKDELEDMKELHKQYVEAVRRLEEIKSKAKEGWLNDDGTLAEDVEGWFADAYDEARKGVENLQDELENEFNLDIDVKMDIDTLGSVAGVVNKYSSEMEKLASVQEAVANGLTITSAKAFELAQTYPQILQKMQEVGAGQVRLNAEVVNAVINGEREKQNAMIDSQTAELKAQIETSKSKIKFYQAQLEVAKAVASGSADLTWKEAQAKLNASNALLGYLIANGVDEAVAHETVVKEMSDDTTDFQTIVSEVSKNNETNLSESAKTAADNIAKNALAMQSSIAAVAKQAQLAAEAIGGMETGDVKGSAEIVGGVKYGESSGGFNIVDTVTEFIENASGAFEKDGKEPEEVDLKELYGEMFDPSSFDDVNDYINALNSAISSEEAFISQAEGAIAGLEAMKKLDPRKFGSGADKGGSKDKEDAAEKARKELEAKYEGELTNVENQKKHLENQIARLEAEDKGVSRSYYDEQIALANKELGILERKKADLEALFAVDPSQETADALWDVILRIQEVGTEAVEASKKIVDLYKTAFEGIGSARDDKNTLFGDRQSYIEGYMELMGLQGHLAPASGYRELMAIEEDEKANNIAKLREQDAQYQSYLNSPEYKAGTETALKAAADMEAEMRATEKAIQDNDIALAQFNEDLENLYVEGWDKVMEAFDNKDFIYSAREDIANSFIDRLEMLNIDVPESAYKNLIDIRKTRQDNLQEELNFAREELVDIEAQFGTNSEAWISKYQEIVDKEKEKYENETQILEWEQTILNKKYEEFNQLIDRLNYTINNMKNIADLVSDKDMANEDGSWTEEGILSLGMNYQQMEHYKGNIEKTAKQIDELEKEKDKWSDNEYNEKWQELNDILWDNIEGYEGAKDAIVDVHEARIDMIESGIEKEISAMEELIDLKKKELDAERDLYDFRKDTQKQAKDIAALERKLASMGGSTDAATIAERAKLEAQLREAKEGLDDTYYGHAMDSQSNALDDELDAYEKSAESYIEKLQESIKDTDALVEKTLTDLMSNADIVLQEITRISELYGVKIDAGITNPWKNAASEASAFKEGASGYLSSMISEEGIITTFGTNAGKSLSGAFGAGSGAVDQFNQDVTKYMGLVESTVNSYTTPGNEKYLGTKIAAPWDYVKQPNSDGPIYAYSTYAEERMDYVTTAAQNDFEAMKDALNHPWLEAQNTVHTFVSDTEYLLDQLVNKAVEKGKAIGDALKIETPNIVGTPTKTNNDTSNNNTTNNTGSKPKTGGGVGPYSGQFSQQMKDLQWVLVNGFNLPVGKNVRGNYSYIADGYWGTTTESSLKKAQKTVGASQTGRFDKQTRDKFSTYLTNQYNNSPDNIKYKKALSYLPKTAFAKGTMGTTKDQWAITDEIGDELVMYATPEGRLSYMRAGSTVIPHDLTKELINIGEVGLDGLKNMPQFNSGVNLMSNYISKPEFNLSFDSLVHVDHCDEGTLKDLEKMVDTKINQFNKQLNQSLRRYK